MQDRWLRNGLLFLFLFLLLAVAVVLLPFDSMFYRLAQCWCLVAWLLSPPPTVVSMCPFATDKFCMFGFLAQHIEKGVQLCSGAINASFFSMHHPEWSRHAELLSLFLLVFDCRSVGCFLSISLSKACDCTWRTDMTATSFELQIGKNEHLLPLAARSCFEMRSRTCFFFLLLLTKGIGLASATSQRSNRQNWF